MEARSAETRWLAGLGLRQPLPKGYARPLNGGELPSRALIH